MFEHDICDFAFYPHAVHALKALRSLRRWGRVKQYHYILACFNLTRKKNLQISYKMSQIRNQGKALEKNPVTAHSFITKTAEAILCN